ncbi:MAG: 30S ribosomal protein S6 [Verrucomicrobiota bacterium]
MKKYEGLFILNTAAKEEGIKEMIDRITADINAAGGRVETVQKMDKRQFSRVANKRFNSGYFVNFIFDLEPAALAQLKHRFDLNDDVFRVLFTIAPEPKPVPAA